MLLLLALLIAACQQNPYRTILHPVAATPGESEMADYRAVDCARIWQSDSHNSVDNPLYWLRAIDCAARLSPAEARAEAHRWPADSWQNAFKQGILLDNGNVTPVERRQYVMRLDGLSFSYPAAVRPLLQLWRSHQAAQLDLSELRTRYHHLQQTSDTELDRLRQQQLRMRHELTDTRRKLDSLTDIERQLSTRKSPDVTESEHAGENNASPPPAADRPENVDRERP